MTGAQRLCWRSSLHYQSSRQRKERISKRVEYTVSIDVTTGLRSTQCFGGAQYQGVEMAGTVQTYDYNKSTAPQWKDTVARVFDQVRAQYPSAWAKTLQRGTDDGEFNKRVAWACKLAGVPCYLNGKRGNVSDPSHDILVFEN